jgi:hypothetical protein
VKRLGGPSKGVPRATSLFKSIQITRSLISSAVRRGIEQVVVYFAMAALPNLAPQIYMTYKLYSETRNAIRAYEEYKKLSETMTKKDAALTEAARIVTRESAKRTIPEKIISDQVSVQVAALISRPEFDKLTGSDTEVKYMLQATLSQFMIGAIIGSRDSLIQQASELMK